MADLQQLAERRAKLSPEQRELLAQRLRGGKTGARQDGIARRAPGAPAPLSFAQQRQWFMWQLDPHSSAYHLCGVLLLAGRLDVDALRASWQALAVRHPSLRTRFAAHADGTLEQVADAAPGLDLPCLDLSTLDAATLADRIEREQERLCTSPFDLAKGPLLRAVLLKSAHDRHRLVVAMHHIVSDGSSTHIILDEMAALYRAHLSGAAPALAQPSIDYADYAAWQRSWLDGAEGQRQLAWWCGRLGGEQTALALQTDRPRKADGRYRAATHKLALDAQLAEGLRKAALAQGGTLFMALMSAFAALLFRHTGQGEVRIGVPVANRNRTETEKLVGFFVNTQVLGARIDSGTTLAALLDQVRETALGAQANQDLPFERLVEALQPQRSLGSHPLFQVMFNHLRQDHRSLDNWPGLTVQRLDVDAPDAQFELTLQTCEYDDGRLDANFTYAAELFDAATVARLARHYLALLRALAERPAQTVGAVALLGEDERRQLENWGVNRRHHAETAPVHRLFEQRAASHPDAPALLFGDTQLSYGELNLRANRLAHRLRRDGVGPDVLVGVALERSLAMVVGLLAILKAGAAYVPLDPEYPDERLAYMIADSGVQLVLTDSAMRPRLPSLTAYALDTLDTSGEPGHDPQPALHGEHLAYVIYTSGSTGRPKGAANHHGALTNRLAWMQDAYRIGPADTILQKTPFSFDVSVWEFFWPLMTGARLALAGPGDHRDPGRLVDLIGRHQVTTLHFVPSMLQAFLAHPGVDGCNRLRRIVCSGEALSAPVRDEVLARLPQAALYNLYGPTEAAIDVTHWTCVADGRSQVPIGQPISGIRTYVLDQDLNLAPQGMAGELYLGGIGLARGYLGRAGLTADRFVADPLSGSGERLYRTGDLVRWNADGQIDYLGRIDHQIKIRGLRVELGEIEAALLAQEEVREAVVVATSGTGGLRLAAYVSAAAAQHIDDASLREQLGRSLPAHMVPSVIVVLDSLPLNANGKVDRKALPALTAAAEGDTEPPQGSDEVDLAGIWSEVLGLGRIGRRDNFFALGGHSLLAAMMISRVRAAMDVDLPLRRVFESQTLQELAACIGQLRGQGRAAPALPLVAAPRADTLPLAPIQQRLWLVERMAGQGDAAYNMAAALRLSGELDAAALRATLDAIVARHESLRTVYPEDDDGQPVARVVPAFAVDLPVTDLSIDPAGVPGKLAALAATPFDLARGPLLHAGLLRLGPTEHVLLLCVHHIAFDGWSQAVFVRDFVAIYQAARGGRTPAFAPLGIQYADYAVWQRRRLDASAERDGAFWRACLADAPVLSTLPPDHVRGAQACAAGSVQLRIPADVAQALRCLAGRHASSLFTVLLAAFNALLHRLAATDDLVIGTDVAGRPHPALEELIGFFVNVVPLRSRRSGAVTFGDWLEQVKQASLAAFDHQELPFDRIVDHARLQRSRGVNPLVQVLFVMQNTPTTHFDIPGLAVEVLPVPAAAAKFDLAVFVSESDGGLHADWVFATSLYRRATVERCARVFNALLRRVANAPDGSLDQHIQSSLEEFPIMNPTPPLAGKLDKLGKLGKLGTLNKAAAPARPQVTSSLLAPGQEFPLVLEAAGADMDGVAWARAERDFIETALRKHGAILFRNFGVATAQDFEAFAEAMEPKLYGSYGDLPKKDGGRNTYKSTPYPEREMILYHNESAHMAQWPRKQWFFCELPSRVGGATPIVDCRDMLRRLPATLVEEMERKELLYVRTFVPRLDVSWQDFFKTDSRAEVETRLAAAGIAWQWLDEHTLQTRTRCPAVVRHPLTRERIFFNQVQLHHVSCLEPAVREDLLAIAGAERMPRQVFFGDGTPIPDAAMAEIGRAYEACAVRFDWRRGDVVMLDNMLAAHARDPYEEPRKIVVAMGDMYDRAMMAAAQEG
ncbi:amino acid adenylation domain-containing protein [Massilia atriviolacea]|uniref:Amino acid adenylation domain-containing protein n=1 Tax=Massilia atriviolacea TaxID=2495579 RepID=A0A430HS82_9BURK|nr:non-ribosomal peptide synthetase [Massilia atriviolacea]RSZ60393.1 amino acid adenylation domain-containing protein [Massilia atriviolacea]